MSTRMGARVPEGFESLILEYLDSHLFYQTELILSYLTGPEGIRTP